VKSVKQIETWLKQLGHPKSIKTLPIVLVLQSN